MHENHGMEIIHIPVKTNNFTVKLKIKHVQCFITFYIKKIFLFLRFEAENEINYKLPSNPLLICYSITC